MPTRDRTISGAPCWIDLMTSDVPRAREFYGQLFGWTSEDPAEEFGGYFNFSKDGVVVAGGMPTMPDAGVDNIWSIYLATDDIAQTAKLVADNGGQVVYEPMQVADFGSMAVVNDPSGATVGVWQPNAHRGFGVVGEPGTPGWFELHTRDHARAVAFYEAAFGWQTQNVGDTDEFRYTVLQPAGEEQLAGVMDASGFLPDGVPSFWTVYIGADDVDSAVATAGELGGSVVDPPQDTPYGRLATIADPMGARIKLVGPNKAQATPA